MIKKDIKQGLEIESSKNISALLELIHSTRKDIDNKNKVLNELKDSVATERERILKLVKMIYVNGSYVTSPNTGDYYEKNISSLQAKIKQRLDLEGETYKNSEDYIKDATLLFVNSFAHWTSGAGDNRDAQKEMFDYAAGLLAIDSTSIEALQQKIDDSLKELINIPVKKMNILLEQSAKNAEQQENSLQLKKELTLITDNIIAQLRKINTHYHFMFLSTHSDMINKLKEICTHVATNLNLIENNCTDHLMFIQLYSDIIDALKTVYVDDKDQIKETPNFIKRSEEYSRQLIDKLAVLVQQLKERDLSVMSVKNDEKVILEKMDRMIGKGSKKLD